MSEKLKECEARRQDSEAHRVTTETRCTELLEHITRYKANEDRLKLRIDTLEAELSAMARQPPKDNPELQQAIAGLNSKLVDFTKIQSEMKQVHSIELHNKEEYIKGLTKQVQDLTDETESRSRSENAKFEAKQAEYEALLVVRDEMEAKIKVLTEERAGFIAATENERKEHEAKSLAYWKKQIQKLQETISGLERQKKGREKQLKDLKKHLGENDPQKLKIAVSCISH
jgi:chromosome segregation ATPase